MFSYLRIRRLTQVGDIDVSPMFVQIFRYEATVAVVWLIFATQKTAIVYNIFWSRFFDASFTHQLCETLFIGLPIHVSCSILP